MQGRGVGPAVPPRLPGAFGARPLTAAVTAPRCHGRGPAASTAGAGHPAPGSGSGSGRMFAEGLAPGSHRPRLASADDLRYSFPSSPWRACYTSHGDHHVRSLPIRPDGVDGPGRRRGPRGPRGAARGTRPVLPSLDHGRGTTEARPRKSSLTCGAWTPRRAERDRSWTTSSSPRSRRIPSRSHAVGFTSGDVGLTTSRPTPAPPRSSARRTSRSRTTSATSCTRSTGPSSAWTTATYGICDVCGKPIEKARVKALPYVDLCIKDAQAQSRR